MSTISIQQFNSNGNTLPLNSKLKTAIDLAAPIEIASSGTLHHALAWAKRGFRVFPLEANSKKGFVVSNWVSAATTDPEQIKKWWADPIWDGDLDYNIGCLTTGWIVADIDVRDGKHGLDSAAGLHLDKTSLTVRTASGGFHIYYAGLDYGGKNEILGPGSGLDVKAFHNYVLAPGSSIGGKFYTVEVDAEIEMVPDVLASLLGPPGTRTRGSTDEISDDSEAALAEAKHYLEHVAPIAVKGQGGNSTAYKVAAKLTRDLGLSEDAATDLMMKHWTPRCIPPAWTERKLGAIVDHANHYGLAEKGSGLSDSVDEVLATLEGLFVDYEPDVPARASEPARDHALVNDWHSALEDIREKFRVSEFPDRTLHGAPRDTVANARAALAKLPVTLVHDVFKSRIMVKADFLGCYQGQLSDNAILALRHKCRVVFGHEPSDKTMRDAAHQIAIQNHYNPVSSYLAEAQKNWDGQPRIGTWLLEYMGAEDTPLNRAIGQIILVAAVRRVREPGTKFDQVIVFESPEGFGKSTAMSILAGDPSYFCDQSIFGLSQKDQQELLAGIWIYECADLSGLGKADVDKVKAFCSRTSDKARPAYGHYLVDQPRTCVFFGTTNNSQYLQSQTGNRRFWPVKVGRIANDKLKADREQLWGEAAKLEACRTSIELPEALWNSAATEQEKRRVVDDWEDLLADLQGGIAQTPDGWEERILSRSVADHLKVNPAIMRGYGRRAKTVMTKLGWTHTEGHRVGGERGSGYTRPASGPGDLEGIADPHEQNPSVE